MFNIDLNQVQYRKGYTFLVIFFSGLLAPFWFIFQFDNSLFQRTETIKLLLISFCIGAPGILFTGILFTYAILLIRRIINGDDVKFKNHLREIVGFEDEQGARSFLQPLKGGSLIVAFTFYIPCILSYFKPMTLRQAINYCILTFIALYIITSIFNTVATIKEKKILKDIQTKKDVG